MIQKCLSIPLIVLIIVPGCTKTTPDPLFKIAGTRAWSGTEQVGELRFDSSATGYHFYPYDTSFGVSLSFPITILNSTTIVLHDTSFFGVWGDTLLSSGTNSSTQTFDHSFVSASSYFYETVTDVVTFYYPSNSISWQYSVRDGNGVDYTLRNLTSVK